MTKTWTAEEVRRIADNPALLSQERELLTAYADHLERINGDGGAVTDDVVERTCERLYGWWWDSSAKDARPEARNTVRDALLAVWPNPASPSPASSESAVATLIRAANEMVEATGGDRCRCRDNLRRALSGMQANRVSPEAGDLFPDNPSEPAQAAKVPDELDINEGSYGEVPFKEGWNACREAMLAAAPTPAKGG